MRVGYDTVPLALNKAGEARYARSLLGALHAADDVAVVPLGLSRRRPGSLLQRVAQQAAAEGLHYPFLVGPRASRASCDVVHFPRSLQPRELGLRVPSVATIHDVLPIRYPELFSRAISTHHRLLLRGVAERATRIITVSEYSKQEIGEVLGLEPERIDVVPSGVEDRFRPVDVDSRWLAERFGITTPYVLCVGTLEPRKNFRTALAAFERLGDNDRSLVIIGGRGWKSADLRAALRQTSARIVVTGYVSDEALVRLYSGADCFVFPSLYEGFGFPVLEAMACGTPVVTSDRASLPEVVGDAGLTADPASTDSVAAAIAELTSSEERRSELAKRGLERARRFSWASAVAATVSVYRRAIEEARH